MRLLLDQNLPRSAAGILRTMGHDAIHAAELGMGRESDRSLLLFAVQQARTVVSMDSDFHTLIATERLLGPSAILLREQGLGSVAVAEKTAALCVRFSEQIDRGCLITSRAESVRVRALPIGPGFIG